MRALIITIGIALTMGACTKNKFRIGKRTASTPAAQDQKPGEASPEEKAKMANSTLVWKRYRALESGVAAALALPKEQLCVEAGTHSCIDKVHLTILGGNDPIDNGQYERSDNPSVLAALAVDRFITSACSQRITLDKGGNVQVFKHFPLNAGSINAEQAKAQATELYQRFLARDPAPQELEVIAGFAAGAGNAEQAAMALCYAIGTQAENIFL